MELRQQKRFRPTLLCQCQTTHPWVDSTWRDSLSVASTGGREAHEPRAHHCALQNDNVRVRRVYKQAHEYKAHARRQVTKHQRGRHCLRYGCRLSLECQAAGVAAQQLPPTGLPLNSRSAHQTARPSGRVAVGVSGCGCGCRLFCRSCCSTRLSSAFPSSESASASSSSMRNADKSSCTPLQRHTHWVARSKMLLCSPGPQCCC